MITLLVILITTTFIGAREPWYHDHRLEWKPFTALPAAAETEYTLYWNIQERSTNGSKKFFAQSMFWNSRGKFLVADASATPTFVLEANQTPGIPSSTAMVKWNKNYDEYFIATSLGLFRFDEDQKQFVTVWSFPYDTKLIASVGNYIFGTVNNSGSQSGQHIWKPNGEHVYNRYGEVGLGVWADPISGKYGVGMSNWVRVVSPTKSIYIDDNITNQYSTDGENTFCSPIGIRNDGKQFYLNGFYYYSDDTVIVLARYSGYGSLWIGKLGGIFHPLSFPFDVGSTFFYSPSTRLLIANQNNPNNLYFTVLPAPDEEVLPKPTICVGETEVNISWPTQHPSVRVQRSSTLISDSWQDMLIPQITVDNKIQVVIPKTSNKMFYRLAMP